MQCALCARARATSARSQCTRPQANVCHKYLTRSDLNVIKTYIGNCGARLGSTSVRGKMSGVQEAALELGIVANLESKLPLSDTTKQIDCKPPLKENGRLSSAKMMTDDGKLQRVKAWQRVEVGVICVVIAVVWGLLSLPVIFYYIPQVSSRNKYFRI